MLSLLSEFLFPSSSCFITTYPLIGGVLVPAGLVFITNAVLFAFVIVRLNRTVRGRSLLDKEKRRQTRRLQNAVAIMILMGLTWTVGYFALFDKNPSLQALVQGLFTVLNSMQGFFVFMLYCVRQPQVRNTWKSKFSCNCIPKSSRDSSTKLTSSGNSTASTAIRSLLNQNQYELQAKTNRQHPANELDEVYCKKEGIDSDL